MPASSLRITRFLLLAMVGVVPVAGARAQGTEAAPAASSPAVSSPAVSGPATSDSTVSTSNEAAPALAAPKGPNPVDGASSSPALAIPAVEKAHSHGKKDEYTGPNTLVELPPTPMLDEEGKQRLDPDGKPIFNAPVRQQRDKKGHPLFDEAGKPVMQTANELGYDEHGKKLHPEKVKTPKAVPVSISRGTLTVDGMTAKAALNYDIADLKYIYLSAPGVGIAVVSHEPFPGATAQPHGFDGNTLTVKVGEHILELTSDKPLLDKGSKPAYVLLDRSFMLPSAAPVMGYGTLRKAPYAWPGAKPNAELAGVAAPPVPESMRPTQLLKPCPAGQMRRATSSPLPGGSTESPCVPISAKKAP